MEHKLPALASTCFWGYFDNSLPEVLTIESGDVVHVETITCVAGDVPDLLMDKETKAIFDAVSPEHRGPGPHIMTGPIRVAGASPGDTLEIRLLGIEPRVPYGVNVAGWWGFLSEDFDRERITVYELDEGRLSAAAIFAFDYPLGGKYPIVPESIIAPEAAAREPMTRDVVVPLRPHFGIVGVAPEEDGKLSSIPPGSFGGNLDNWRMGAGSAMYLPVFQEGALFYVGDGHAAEGDGELSGTAIEASMNGTFQVVVKKDFPVGSPVIETDTSWYTHGFASDLNEAMKSAARAMLELLTSRMGFTRSEAYSLMSVAGDFGVTQVANMKHGIHVGIPKNATGVPW